MENLKIKIKKLKEELVNTENELKIIEEPEYKKKIDKYNKRKKVLEEILKKKIIGSFTINFTIECSRNLFYCSTKPNCGWFDDDIYGLEMLEIILRKTKNPLYKEVKKFIDALDEIDLIEEKIDNLKSGKYE